jgi:hypothetical protein
MMAKKDIEADDPAANRPSPTPREDAGDVTPPHGDEIVNEDRIPRSPPSSSPQ